MNLRDKGERAEQGVLLSTDTEKLSGVRGVDWVATNGFYLSPFIRVLSGTCRWLGQWSGTRHDTYTIV